MWATQLADEAANRLAEGRGNEVELTGLGPPGEIAGFALSTNCRFSTVHRGPVLETVDNRGDFVWLGVRDGFRDWLIHAA
jgi:hypothetical protein